MGKNVENILCDLVDIKSDGKIEENHEIFHYLDKYLEKCLDVISLKTKSGNVNLLIGVNCNLKYLDKCILLSGHIDTVTLSDDFVVKSKIDNNKVQGLGSGDMKAFWASILYNLEEYKKLEYPIVLSLTSDEETEFKGIYSIVEEMKSRNITPKFVIVGEPSSSKFSLSNMGNIPIWCNIYGKSCHASKPENGINALKLCAKLMDRVDEFNLSLQNASLCVTKIISQNATNVVPDFCKMYIDCRISTMDDYQKIMDKLNEYLIDICGEQTKSNIENLGIYPPFEKKNNDFIVKYANSENIELTTSNFSTEAGVIQQRFNDCEIVIYGVGNPNNIHNKDEEVDIDKLRLYTKNLLKLIKEYAKEN